MKTLKDFTPEIKAKIPLYKDKAVRDLYDGTEYENWDRKDTVEYIEYVYKLGKQQDKPVVIVADNLLEYRKFYNMLFNSKLNKKTTELVNKVWLSKNNKPMLFSELESELRSELDSELYSELGSELSSELYSELESELDSELESELESELDSELSSELYSELRSELSSELRSELSSELYSELESELDSELYSELGSELGSELESELGKSAKYHWLFITNEYARVYLMWYKFIQDEFNLKTKKEDHLNWLYNNVNKSNIAKCFLCKRVVLVLRMPKKMSFKNSRLHNSESSAIQYNNQEMYFIEGVKISKELFDKLQAKEYTLEDFSKESNEEIKSACIGYLQEVHGDEYVFDFFRKNLTELDTFVDKKDEKYLEGTLKTMNVGVYTLFKGQINNVDVAYVRCYCPSTDRMFFLGVEPSNKNSKDAIASLYQVPKVLRNNIVSISRQGEKFSTIFDTETTEKLKNNSFSEKELKEYISLSGEDYFKLITYEF